ncbi:MAG: hypothetical protein V3T17_07695 [Pseudomonadales bacterium]
MKYLLNTVELEPADEKIIFQIIVEWFVSHNAIFEAILESGFYASSQLQNLGHYCHIKEIDKIAINFPYEKGLLAANGKLTKTVVNWLLNTPVPASVIAGELSPVMKLEITLHNQTSYLVQDYGRTSILDLTKKEANELCLAFVRKGADFANFVPWDDLDSTSG